MPKDVTLDEELRYEDENDTRNAFHEIFKKDGSKSPKYSIKTTIKIEKRTIGRKDFKDIFKVVNDLSKAVPEKVLYASDLNIRTTIKQTIELPIKFIYDGSELKSYLEQLNKTLHNFLFDKGVNRYISNNYRVIDYDYIVTDLETKEEVDRDQLELL